MCQAQISDRDPQSGQVVKKFSSNKEEDAQNIRHYIDGILGQIPSRISKMPTKESRKRRAIQKRPSYGGDTADTGGGGADTGDEDVTVATVVMEVCGGMDATGDMEVSRDSHCSNGHFFSVVSR
ncbi:hypothetical protein K493DRAFT_320565 [Basidiobolus meristosporus CBS 931.73]|uniref:Uncharacterized protein n=1 Tax=Basidiobolus meristosporus CBS 931.73 TaxID=1314790 RepID=A0A1Y1X957_9FUNG|nr:hypothetical protein K493DRAFT_320565 [Basidiobolus meristosporus CBS 931.73]|eukprot:ORX81874.1 hypothetical protein K493DRAFT_320565 [Basidiobolus meristosporus CBS 931.73]